MNCRPSKYKDNLDVPGKLIVVEGIDGSGKSTQIHLLEKWLRFRDLPVFMTEWNSSDTVKQITSRGKKKGVLLRQLFLFCMQQTLQIDMKETFFL